VDGFGELTGAPGQPWGWRRIRQVFELGVGALAGCAKFRVGAVGLFLRAGLFFPRTDLCVRGTLVALVSQSD
jgi:hypothetical protein